MTFRDITLIVVILCLVFLFQGEPDMWDLLHEKAMQAAKAMP